MKQGVLLSLALLAVLVMAFTHPAQGQGIRSSEFDGAVPDTFWTFVDPRGGCTLTMTGTHANISIPAGLSRDPVSYGQGGNRAPRLVQRVGPPGSDVGDFGLIAKFDGVQTRQYQIQGILAIQDEYNYVRSEFFSDTSGINALLFTFDNDGQYVAQKRHLLPDLPSGCVPLLLRLDRWENIFTQYYSTDGGGSWIRVDSVMHTINVDSIAVYAASSDSVQVPRDPDIHAPAFEGFVDYLRFVPILPVQLASFTATAQGLDNVVLNWMTISETNNYGFNVQKALDAPTGFQTVPNSFVPGHGTTLEPRHYTYTDRGVSAGNWYYRLQQIDLNGTIHYSEPVHTNLLTGVGEPQLQPTRLALGQNYPNPFNPSTAIAYEVPQEGRVTLEVFNLIGQKVATVLDEVKPAGFYSLEFGATQLTSGVYMYKLTAGNSSIVRKMVLLK
ncbi:T9SS type A sorting domain-containing protein [Sphingobacteriales bacterium CHB3]|nr:T9SS type A sorting domain-containing protein [Sphingobacteriales bacterium CHB3]